MSLLWASGLLQRKQESKKWGCCWNLVCDEVEESKGRFLKLLLLEINDFAENPFPISVSAMATPSLMSTKQGRLFLVAESILISVLFVVCLQRKAKETLQVWFYSTKVCSQENSKKQWASQFRASESIGPQFLVKRVKLI